MNKNREMFQVESCCMSEWCISPAVPKPPSVAPSVAPRDEEVGWLKPKEAEPGPGWPEPCEKRDELWELLLREDDP